MVRPLESCWNMTSQAWAAAVNDQRRANPGRGVLGAYTRAWGFQSWNLTQVPASTGADHLSPGASVSPWILCRHCSEPTAPTVSAKYKEKTSCKFQGS